MITAALALVIFACLGAVRFTPQSFWWTPDQQAQRWYEKGEYAEAARLFTDPMRQGAALFRDGQFEAAANAFSRVNSAEGHFNRGNALVMRGQYDDAVKSYERALSLRADWPAAVTNLEIARLRGERTKREGGDMGDQKIGADEIVVETGKNRREGGQTEETEGAQALSDAELQSLWLRRVQTKPADFLRAKFAFQLATEDATDDLEVAP